MSTFRSAILLATLFAGSLLAPAKAQAASPELYTGYYIGAAHAICGLLVKGYISRQYTEDLLYLLETGHAEAPRRSVDRAFAMLRTDETVKNCPIPPRR